MAPAATRAAVERYVAALNGHDADAIAGRRDGRLRQRAHVGDGRQPCRPGRVPRRPRRLPDRFGDLHYEVEDTLVDGDRAAVAYA